jgi:hypothetical protein
MSVMTRGNFTKIIWPGVNEWYGQSYTEYQVEWKLLGFQQSRSNQAYEEEVGISGLGLASEKTEGNSITYDEENQAYITRYINVVYGLGFKLSRELYEDNLYGSVGFRRSKALAFSMRQTKETVAGNIFARAFNSSFTGGDGKELLATDHPNWAGGTWQNELTTAADLSENSLEQACIDISKWTNDRGLKIRVIPRKLIGPPDLQFDMERLLATPYRVGTANNDTNALHSMGKFPDGYCVNHYLGSDTDAWFLRTDVQNGLKMFQRRKMEFTVDNEFDTENASFKATERYVFGWTDPRGLYGSPGA